MDQVGVAVQLSPVQLGDVVDVFGNGDHRTVDEIIVGDSPDRVAGLDDDRTPVGPFRLDRRARWQQQAPTRPQQVGPGRDDRAVAHRSTEVQTPDLSPPSPRSEAALGDPPPGVA